MPVDTRAPRTRPVRRDRRTRLGVGLTGLAATLTLTGCLAQGGEPTPDPGQTTATTASPSGTSTQTDGATAGAPGVLPSAELHSTDHEGGPRRLEDIFHLECIHALDGEDVPETEDAAVAAGDQPVWSVMSREALTEGWKSCPTMMYGRIAIPAAFGVEASPGGGTIDRLRIFDARGQQLGGVGVDGATAAAPQGAEVVEVVEVTEARPSPAYGEEVPYLRSLVLRTGSGHQLMVDLVSAPAGADPETLEVWDLAAFGGGSRHLVYASIPLDSLQDADEAAASELHAVLRSMVGSYTLPVQ